MMQVLRFRFSPFPDGIRRFYASWDFRPGVWIDVFSRPMFIYECVGEQTKQFMTQQFGEVDFRNCTNEVGFLGEKRLEKKGGGGLLEEKRREDFFQVLLHGPPPLTFERAPNQLKFYAKLVGGTRSMQVLALFLNRQIINPG